MEKVKEFWEVWRKPEAKVELGERRIWLWDGDQGGDLEVNDVRFFWEDEKKGFKKRRRRKRRGDEG